MTDFIADALELLPEPAALFECPNLRYVASNATASRHARRLFGGHVPDAAEVARQIGLDTALARASLHENGHYAIETRYGNIQMSKMRTQPLLSRPDLLLCTLHPDMSMDDAWFGHHRMLAALRLNENGQIALRSMENSLLQMHAALSAQSEMLLEYNHRTAELMRVHLSVNKTDGSA